MWSDPDTDNPGFTVSPRGAGYLFGEDIQLYYNRELYFLKK